MTALVNSIDQQIDRSIYSSRQTSENKHGIAAACENIKIAAAVAVCTAPIFALFFPKAFSLVVCLIAAVISYDIFNMADNLGDAARHSAQGILPAEPRSNTRTLIENTLLAGRIYKRMLAT
jgi:hypothetical protein